jgi:hypothetical protein
MRLGECDIGRREARGRAQTPRNDLLSQYHRGILQEVPPGAAEAVIDSAQFSEFVQTDKMLCGWIEVNCNSAVLVTLTTVFDSIAHMKRLVD